MPILIQPLAHADPAAVEALLDAAFGRDRHRRTAYRLREGVVAIPALSLGAFDRDVLVGTVQCWPIALFGADGSAEPLVLLGPVAVMPDRQQHGIGRMLMRAALGAADAAREPPLLLIGDPEYYERLFGFHAGPTQGWTVPGPVERHRLLVRLTNERTLPPAGIVGPRPHPVQNAPQLG